MSQITMEKVVGLAKSRGFVYPGFTGDFQTRGITVRWV